MTRVTIAEIAEEVGVSVPTVSKVLNARPDVAPNTRERVEEALRNSNYRRRQSGAPPASTRGQMLELVLNSIETPWALEIIRGVQRVANKRGYGVVLNELGDEHQPSDEWIRNVLKRRPAGVILVLSTLQEEQQWQLTSRGIPFALVDAYGEPPAGIPTVGSNNWLGGLEATRHLIELGHKRIAMISGPREYPCSRARVDGFRSAHDEADLKWDPKLIKWGNFNLDGGYEKGMELLSIPNPPTAVFAGSDYQALGLLRACRERNIQVPNDMSIVGYDNLPLSDWVSPQLTTINQPLEAMASTATQMVLETASETSVLPNQIDLSTHLVVRASTAPPPTHG